MNIYNENTGTWNNSLSLSVARYSLAAAATSGVAVFAGGWSGILQASNQVDIFDVATLTRRTTTLSAPRASLAVAAAGARSNTSLIFPVLLGNPFS